MWLLLECMWQCRSVPEEGLQFSLCEDTSAGDGGAFGWDEAYWVIDCDSDELLELIPLCSGEGSLEDCLQGVPVDGVTGWLLG